MPKNNHKTRIKELCKQLDALSVKPKHFDLIEIGNRVNLASEACKDAYNLYQRIANRTEEENLWYRAASMFHQTLAEAYPDKFYEDIKRLAHGDVSGLDTAIDYLRLDPWFFRSGYVKANLIRFICRVSISTTQASQLQDVVIAAIDLRDRREFRWYCRLAKAVYNMDFEKRVTERLTHLDAGIRRRARWVLSAMTHDQSYHVSKGKQFFAMNKYSEAIEQFDRAILLEPGSVGAFLWRGITFCKQENFESAITDFETTVQLSKSAYYLKYNYEHSHQHFNWRPRIELTEKAQVWLAFAQDELSKQNIAGTST